MHQRFHRKIEEKILDWLDHSNTALLITGAPRTGKTIAVEQALGRSGRGYLEVNLWEDTFLRELLKPCTALEDLVSILTKAKEFSFIPEETVVFLDDVEALPGILSRIKPWVEDGRYRFIFGGCYLDKILEYVPNVPVAQLTVLTVYPVDVQEFLDIFRVSKEEIQTVEECFRTIRPVPEPLHRKMMTHYRNYLQCGGIPRAVESFGGFENLIDMIHAQPKYSGLLKHVPEVASDVVFEVQRKVQESYLEEFEEGDRKLGGLRQVDMYKQILLQLEWGNQRFRFDYVDKNRRFEELAESLSWLELSGTVLSVPITTKLKSPLVLGSRRDTVKLYLGDVGLLYCYFRIAAIRKKDLFGRGVPISIYANAVAQELHAKGFELYSYYGRREGEVDFLLEQDGVVVPLALQPGDANQIPSGLKNIMGNPKNHIPAGYVLANSNVRSVPGSAIHVIPFYMTMCFRNTAKPSKWRLPRWMLDRDE